MVAIIATWSVPASLYAWRVGQVGEASVASSSILNSGAFVFIGDKGPCIKPIVFVS